jgi:ABC-type nickel/cobalt efflux system permease component RcnA
MDAPLTAALGIGFLLGLRHALDADHVVAVSTFVSQERGLLRACLRGAFWGLGHTLALLAVGVAVVAFKLTVSPELERGLETVVALVLIALGGHVLLRASATGGLHRHAHSHDGVTHTHLHVHGEDPAGHDHAHLFRGAPQPLLMGLLHGLAGSGALMLLVLATLPSPGAALLYVVVFGVGSTVGMLALSGLISLPFVLWVGDRQALGTGLRVAIGAASILVGVVMLVTN